MAGKAGLVDNAKPDKKGLGNGVLTEAEVDDVAMPHRKAYNIPLEERMYYATIQRWTYLRDKNSNSYKGENADVKAPAWFRFFASNTRDDAAIQEVVQSRYPEKGHGLYGPLSEQEAYRMQLTRQLRNANWLAMLALIITVMLNFDIQDVIGPFNAPYAFSTLGFVGGILLYFTFGIAAIWGSFLLLNLYLRLDSDRFPIRSYGALVEVFFGRPGRYTISAAQILQCLFITATNIIANAQGMSQLTGNNGSPLCFIISIVIWTIVGCVISVLFRSFKYLSSVAYVDAAVNISLVFITMGFIAHSPPNYESAQAAYGYDIDPPAPIAAVAIVSGELSNAVNGAMNMVFAWSGLMIFVEFMSEMRNPFDFVKSFMGSECVILIIYVMFGAYTYAFQGQYVLPVAFQGVSNYVWQSVGNGLSLWTYTIASVIYLNVAMKVAYTLLFEDLFRGPALYSTKGRILWTALQVAAWAIAFVIGTAIPQVQTLQALIGAALLLQFSYTLPPIMQWLLDVRCDAADEDSPFVPGMTVQRRDTWGSLARWRRGLFGGRWWLKGINFAIFLAGLATCGLGIWGSVVTIKQTFAESAATSFGCDAPV